MTRDGAVELNKATGGAERISARDAPANSHAADNSGNAVIGGVVDRVLVERRAAKKKAVRKANAEIFERGQGKPETTRLVFRERDKPPNGKLTHALDRPKRELALAVHSEIKKHEGDNVGVEAAHSTEQAAEGAARYIGTGHKRLKLQPHRATFRAEEKAINKNANALYQRSLRQNPELRKANPIKKALHKRKVKRDYAKAFRQSGKGAKAATVKSSKMTVALVLKLKVIAAKVVAIAAANAKLLLIIGGGLLLLILLMAGISSCMSMLGGGFNAVIGTSYTAEDADITGADADYTARESQLAARIDNIESEFPGYDEYVYNIDAIGHNPFVLASYLTAKFQMYTRAGVQAELAALFAQQYTLTLTPIVEIRYRTETYTDTWTDEDGNTHSETYTVEVAYEYHILYVTLTNRGLESVVLSNLTPEQTEMYHVYMQTRGNRAGLFEGNPHVQQGNYFVYDVPPEALNDAVFAAMLAEAEKYLGYPYVWGGSSPSTSFDCSGYVSWVINNTGWNVGRLTARGLFNICIPVSPADARPGDLVFFWRTYAAPDPNAPTHVGIYVGGGYMIHCGNPISYADITTPYWVRHFYSFGRLP